MIDDDTKKGLETLIKSVFSALIVFLTSLVSSKLGNSDPTLITTAVGASVATSLFLG